MRSSLLTLSILVGCTEYNISEKPPAFGEPNPPSVENPVKIDKIVQVTSPAVDILWVIDVSGSMLEEQNDLAENFPAFMDYFLGSGLDYHIGVISTSMRPMVGHQGRLQESTGGDRWITPDTTDAKGDFATMAMMGDGVDDIEAGLEATFACLETMAVPGGYNDGFFRKGNEEAGLHVNIISDENDYSDNAAIGGGPAEFIDWFESLKPAASGVNVNESDLATFNSIVNPPGSGLLEGTPGTRYITVTDGAGGVMHDIHGGDWIAVLEALGIQAAGLKSEYFLSHLPVVSSLDVKVELLDGTVLPFAKGPDYTYDASRNSITFTEYIPDPLSSVFIEYTILSSMVEVEEEE